MTALWLARRKIDAVIFDFDHTLVELGQWVDWQAAVLRVTALYHKAGVDVGKAGSRVGFGMIRELDRALRQIDVEVAAEIRAKAYAALAEEEVRGAEKAQLIAGAARLLDRLERAGVAAAIVSSNAAAAIEACLRRLGQRERFAAIVGRSPQIPLKPDPASFVHCLDMLGLEAGRVLAVGDSPSDIEPATALGMPSVGVAAGEAGAKALSAAGASFVVGDLGELTVLLTESGRGPGQKLR